MTIRRRTFLKHSLALSAGMLLPSGLIGCAGTKASESAYDIVVYGGTSGGIIAAIQAARMGRSVVLVEPSDHLGGLTTGGLGRTDLGIKGTIGGMSLEFYRRIREHYSQDTPWVHETRADYMDQSSLLEPGGEAMFGFEPHAARKVYEQMLQEAGVPVVMNERIILGDRGVDKNRDKIEAIETESGNVYKGQIFIDATYEGDLMAMAGVSYHVGREANARYDETLNGVQKVRTHNHIFPGFVDPWMEPGNPRSGLLPEVHDGDPGVDGEGDHRVQAYCFRMCLSDVPENQIPFEQPDGYDELQYELLFRNYEAGETRIPWLPGGMPNRKTDTNNRWGFSTNQIGVNYAYPDGDYATRERIVAGQEHYQLGLMWTLAHHPRIPEQIRNEVGRWGLAVDEFTDTDGWPTQIYVREARRMIGEYVMSEHDCRRVRMAGDPIGLGSYTMDSHNVQRYVTEGGCVQNEGNIEVSPQGPYAISYRSLLPRRQECTNLLVSSAISSSHIAFGSIRMEPVFMLLGQAAATAAVLSLDEGAGGLHELEYPKLRTRLLADGQKLDVDTGRYPPAPPEPEKPDRRARHPSEPVIEDGCMVRG